MSDAVDSSPEGLEEKLDRLIELTERQNALLEGSTEDDLSEPLVKVSTRREVEFLAGVRAVDGPIATATLAARLGWKQEINAHRALAIARFLAKQLDRRGLVRSWTAVGGHIMVEPSGASGSRPAPASQWSRSSTRPSSSAG